MKPRAALLVRVGAASLQAEARRQGVVVWAAEVEYAGIAELADRLAELVSLPDLPLVERSVEVRLLPPLAQLRHLDDLPRVSDSALLGMLAHQPQRFFRKNGKPLITDGVWLRPRRSFLRARAASVAALVAAAEVPVIDAIAAGIRAAGFDLAEIRPEHSVSAALSLLPGAERGARIRARVRRLAWSAGVACALWVALGAGLFLRQRRALAKVNRELAAIGGPVEALLVARARGEEVVRMTEAVRRGDDYGARLSALLVGLVRALPDSAFVTSVAVREDGSGTMSGAAVHPAQVVVQLERSGVVNAPHLEGQGVREEIGGREMERFTVLFGGGRR